MGATVKKSKTYIEAEAKLPTTLRPIFEQMIDDYRFAALKHHGSKFYSPKVIAELILMGWRP